MMGSRQPGLEVAEGAKDVDRLVQAWMVGESDQRGF